MNIKIWSDIACPFCYIGKKHLEIAAEKVSKDLQLDVEWMSFQLDPNAAESTDKSIYELLAQKYGHDLEWAHNMNDNMVQMGEKVGLEFDMNALQPTNTLKAHLLLHEAKGLGKQTELKDLLFEAYFVKGQNISEEAVLISLAEEVGINADRAKEVVEGKVHAQEVQDDILLAQRYGIQGVPFFIINDKYALSGAQPVEAFEQALTKVLEEQQEASV